MEKECSRCQAGDNPNHTHNTEYGKLSRSKSKSSLSNPNHPSAARSKALEKKKEYSGAERNASMRKHKSFYVKENKDLWGHK